MSTPIDTGYSAEGRNPNGAPGAASSANGTPAPVETRSTETKKSFRTTELMVYIAAVAGVLIASELVGTTHGHHDYFRANTAWFYIVLLTIGYMVSRGLAKAGSREYYDRRS